MTKVSAVVLTYNSKNYIKPCLEALFRSYESFRSDFILSIILVDNNSPDDTGELIKKFLSEISEVKPQKLPLIKFIQSQANKGFAAGVNLGIRETLKSDPDYLFILNPDTKVFPGALKKLIDTFTASSAKFKNIGIVGAQMIYSNKTPQGTFGNFPSLLTEFLQITRLYKIFPFGRFIPYNRFSAGHFKKIRSVDWVSAGAMMIKKEVIQKIGLFDENYFMYIEDIDFCRRARAAGFEILYNPEAKIWHKLQGSFQSVKFKIQGSSLFFFSKILSFFKNFFKKTQNPANIWQKESLAYYFKKWRSGLPEAACRHSAYHLEPAGYRKLKFIINNLNNLTQLRLKKDNTTSQSETKSPFNRLTILDLGCGNGNIALALGALGFNTVGADISKEIIEKLKIKTQNLEIPKVDFIELDANDLTALKSKKFDVIIMSEILEHLKEPLKTLNQAKNFLSQNGIVIATIPNKFSLEEKLRRLFFKNPFLSKIKSKIKKRLKDNIQSASETPHLHFFSFDDFQKISQRAGFKIIASNSQSAGFKSFYYIIGRLFLRRQSPIFQKLDRLDSFLAQFIPPRWGDGIMFILTISNEKSPNC